MPTCVSLLNSTEQGTETLRAFDHGGYRAIVAGLE